MGTIELVDVSLPCHAGRTRTLRVQARTGSGMNLASFWTIRPSTSTEPATEDHNQAKKAARANVKKAAKAAKKKKRVKHLPKKTPSALGKEGAKSRAGEGCREINPPLGATSDGLMQCVRSKGFEATLPASGGLL